jgi:hypothetical protein
VFSGASGDRIRAFYAFGTAPVGVNAGSVSSDILAVTGPPAVVAYTSEELRLAFFAVPADPIGAGVRVARAGDLIGARDRPVREHVRLAHRRAGAGAVPVLPDRPPCSRTRASLHEEGQPQRSAVRAGVKDRPPIARESLRKQRSDAIENAGRSGYRSGRCASRISTGTSVIMTRARYCPVATPCGAYGYQRSPRAYASDSESPSPSHRPDRCQLLHRTTQTLLWPTRYPLRTAHCLHSWSVPLLSAECEQS